MNKRHANQRLIQAVRTICASGSGLSVPAVALLGFSMVSVALAGPTGGVVVSGDATISTPGAGRTVIEQGSQHVQLNWNTFDVAASESVQFQQPSSSAVALNRILDQNPSQIFGRLEANGQVILVNPNGILFGHSAQLNVGSLVASSLDAIGFDAATGRYTFGTSRSDVGAIINDGAITAARGGSVTLLGGRVTNTGSIVADFGTVNLAAGRAATLDLAGDGLLRLEVDGELLSNNAGANAAVENSGAIEANGGQVLLTAQAVDDVFANLVNNSGVVRANRIDNSGGTIRLMGAGGTVRSSGVLDASAGDAVSSGGAVEMLGEQVGLFGAALVDVSGATSGGTALIGGDYQGKNPNVLNAARTYVSADANIRADAGIAGDGGRVIVWADGITRFNGSISARGGALSGNGGFAEVSGKGTLLFRGSANLSASNGFAGELLLDPRNIIVATGGAGNLAGTTGDDSDPYTYAFAEDLGDDITVAPTTITNILDTGTTVTLQAHNDITVTNAINGSGSVTPGGELIFQAGDDIFINADVRTNNGAIQFTAGDDTATPVGADGDGELRLASGVTLSAGAAAVTLNSDGDMQLLGTVSGSAITATSGGAMTVATLNAGAGSVNLNATGSLLDDGINTTRITGGLVTLNADAIGASTTDDEIDTAASVLQMISGSGVYIGELDGLALGYVAANGVGNDVSVTSTTGNIGVSTVIAPDTVRLIATAGAIIDDNSDLTNIRAATLMLTAGTAIGATGGEIDTEVTLLTASAGAGSVYIEEVDGLTLTNVSAAGAGNDVNVRSTTGDIVVNTVTAADAVSLVALGGAINDDNNDATRINAGRLTLYAATAIGAADSSGQIDTDVTSLTATATVDGLYIGELNGLTLTNVRTFDSGNVSVISTTGDIVVNTVRAPDQVLLSATTGSIIDDNDNTTRIQARALTLTAGTAIGATGVIGQIDTDATSLTATASDGGVYIGELDGLTLADVRAVGAGNDIEVTNTTGDIRVNLVSGAGAVRLAATAGAINDDNDNTTRIAAGALTLTASTGIGTNAPTSGQIDTNVTSLTATTTGFGGVYIGELNGLTLTNVSAAGGGNDVVVTSTSGNIDVNTVSALDEVRLNAMAGAITADNSSSLITAGALTLLAGTTIGATGATGQIDTNATSLTAITGSGSIYIGELDGLTLTNVSAGGVGTDVEVTNTTGNLRVDRVSAQNRVILTATAGAINDDNDDATRIAAGALTLTASTGIGANATNGKLDTNVTSLTANTTGFGGVYIDESNGLTLTNVSAAGAGNVNVTSTTGNIVVNTVTTAGAVALAATNGAIVDDNNDASVIAGNSVSLSAATNIGTVVNFDATNDSDVGSSIDVQTFGALTATVVGTIGQINLNISGAPILTTGAITLGSGSNRSGAIVLQSAGNLNAAAFVPGTINIGSNNDTSVGLRAGGLLILPSSAGFTDQSASRLLVRGAGDVIDSDGSPREFTLAATALDFRSGAAGGATILNTSVDQLSASVGNNQNLTVNETDSLTLGTLAAGNGNIVLTAGGAVSDDGVDLTRIVSNVATLSGSSLGTASNALDTQVNTLTASATSGGVYINEADALALTNVSATGGAADVRTADGSLTVAAASGDGVTLIAGGAGNAITLNGTVNAGAGDVTLTAGTDGNRGAIVAGAGNQVSGGLLTATGAAIGTGADRLNTTVASLNATSENGGVFITEADALNLTANATGGAVDVQTTNGALTVTSATGAGVTLTAGAGSDITLNGAVNAGAGDVMLTAGTVGNRGAIVAGAGNQVRGGLLTATGAAIGTGADRLNTTVASLNVTSENGGVFITEANGVSLAASATGGAVDVETTNGALTVTQATGNVVTLTSGGAGNGITLNGVVNAGAGDVTLTAGTVGNRGAIVADAGNQVSGGLLTATGAAIGAGADRLNTTVTSLNATSENGGVFITEADALNLTANATGGAVDVQTTNGALTVTSATGAGVTLTAGGAGNSITLDGAVNAGAGDVTLTAGTAPSRGAIIANIGHQILGDELTAIGSTIGTGAARLNTAVASLNATSTNGGIFVTEANGLTLASANAAGAGSEVNVTSTTGDIVVNAVSATDAVTLTATAGAITDDGNDATRIAGGALTLTAGTAIGATGATGQIDTDVTSLTASAGGVYIGELNDLTLTNVSATGDTADVRTANGSLTVAAASGNGVTLIAGGAGNGITLDGAVNAGAGDVTLTAGTVGNRGAIVAGIGSQITGNALTATGATIGTGAARLNTAVTSLDASSTNGGIFVTEADALNLTANASGDAVDVQTTNGALTVTQATGNVVTLTSGGAGNGITLDGTVNAGAGDVTLTAGTVGNRGAIVAGAGNQVSGGLLTATGAAIGTGADRLNTTVASLNATSENGGVFITEADALSLTANATGGAVDVQTTNGALTVTSATGAGVTLTAGGAGSDITLDGAVNAGAGDVTLTAGTVGNRGAIVAGIGSQITGNALTATGATIGTGAARLNTIVASLNATSTNGGVFITEADAVNLAASASGGAVDVETTNGALTVTSATGAGVTLTAGGAGSDITLNGAVNAGAGDVTLTAGTVASRGAIVAGAGNQITAGSLTATGATIGTGAARLNTTVASLNATSTNGGIFITEADALNLTANATGGAVDVQTTDGALNVTSATGAGVTLTAGGAGNGITLNGAVNAGAGNVTLTAGTVASRGAIVAGAGNQITAGSLSATGATIGTGAARLNTAVTSLDASSTNGGIFVTEADALNLTANATGGAVDVQTTNGALTVTSANGAGVTLTAGGAGNGITLNGAVNADAGDVTLTAGTVASRGAIVAGAGNQISGGSLTATGTTIGTGAARLNTSVASLNATSTNGGIFITESDAVSLAANATGGAVDVRTANGSLTVTQATGNAVRLSSGGAGNDVTLNGTVNAGAGDVTLTAGTAASRGAIIAGAGNQITGSSLTARGSAIGTGNARLNTSVNTLNAISTNGGIFITEADALNLTANATGGAVDVQTGNGSLTVLAVSDDGVSGDGVTLTAGGAGSEITLLSALNAGAGDVTLTAGTTASRGAIVSTLGRSISGRSLTATAATIGASNARLNTNIETLNAVASTGDVYVSEQNGLTLANVSAARDIGVTSAAGNIVVNTVSSAGGVTLTATSGAISDDGDNSTRLSANSLTLSARSIGAASTLSGATLDSTARLDTDVTTLNATATAGGIFIDEANGLQNVNVQASGGATGDIELLTLAGDLILRQVSASDTLLLAAGRNIFAAPGASPVTARVAELRAGTTDSSGGQIGTIADLIEFQLSAGNSLRLFVPQTIDPNDPNRAPATLPSTGVTSTLNLFGPQSALASLAGFNQFQGFGETQFTSPAEALVRTLQNQTGTVQTGLEIDWGSLDSDVSLFGTLEPSVCLPGDQRDEETSTPEC